jgi:hypothetical protein
MLMKPAAAFTWATRSWRDEHPDPASLKGSRRGPAYPPHCACRRRHRTGRSADHACRSEVDVEVHCELAQLRAGLRLGRERCSSPELALPVRTHAYAPRPQLSCLAPCSRRETRLRGRSPSRSADRLRRRPPDPRIAATWMSACVRSRVHQVARIRALRDRSLPEHPRVTAGA